MAERRNARFHLIIDSLGLGLPSTLIYGMYAGIFLKIFQMRRVTAGQNGQLTPATLHRINFAKMLFCSVVLNTLAASIQPVLVRFAQPYLGPDSTGQSWSRLAFVTGAALVPVKIQFK